MTLIRPEGEIRVKVKCSLAEHGKVCQDTVVQAQHLDTHLTVLAVTHGKVSGMDSGIRVRYQLSLVNPERDVIPEEVR